MRFFSQAGTRVLDAFLPRGEEEEGAGTDAAAAVGSLRSAARGQLELWEFQRARLCFEVLEDAYLRTMAVLRLRRVMPAPSGRRAAQLAIAEAAERYSGQDAYRDQLPPLERAYLAGGEMADDLEWVFRHINL